MRWKPKHRSIMALADEYRKIEGRDLFDQHGQQRNGILVIGIAKELPPAITVEAPFVPLFRHKRHQAALFADTR
jgi:hypothetical protein